MQEHEGNAGVRDVLRQDLKEKLRALSKAAVWLFLTTFLSCWVSPIASVNARELPGLTE